MKVDRFVKVMLLVVALLLLANFLKPALNPPPSYAQTEDQKPVAITGSGNAVWIVVGTSVYYVKLDSYDEIRITGPEELEE